MRRHRSLLLIGPLAFMVMAMLSVGAVHYLGGVTLPGVVVILLPNLALSLVIIGAALWVAFKITDG